MRGIFLGELSGGIFFPLKNSSVCASKTGIFKGGEIFPSSAKTRIFKRLGEFSGGNFKHILL